MALHNSYLSGDLPSDCKCPAMFYTSGGTCLICVSGGPGNRFTQERMRGKCEVSHTGADQVNSALDFVPIKVTRALKEFIRTPSNFKGADRNCIPVVYHDGAPKSEHSYQVFVQTALYSFRDGMPAADGTGDEAAGAGAGEEAAGAGTGEAAGKVTADYFWQNGLNRSDVNTVKTAVLFCSLETIYRILRKCNLITPSARITMPSGGIAVINLPIGALPSFSIAAGPFASHTLHWGTVTEQEYTSIHGPAGASEAAGASEVAGGEEKRARVEP